MNSDLILAIDPGTTKSAWVLLDVVGHRVVDSMPDADNGDLVDWLGHRHIPSLMPSAIRAWGRRHNPTIVIEKVESYGMPVGAEVFETVWWSGRFAEAACHHQAVVHRLGRMAVKMALCRAPNANDASIRQALLDRFGGKGSKGTVKEPGPLYGLSRDGWSALAVAVTWAETNMGVTEWLSGSGSDGPT